MADYINLLYFLHIWEPYELHLKKLQKRTFVCLEDIGEFMDN